MAQWSGWYVWTENRRHPVVCYRNPEARDEWRCDPPSGWAYVRAGWLSSEGARAALGDNFEPGDIIVNADDLRALALAALARLALEGAS